MQAITTALAPEARGHYAQAIVHGGLAFVSGQLPVIPDRPEARPAGFEEEARQVLRNVLAIVEAAGNEKLAEAYRAAVQQLHLWRLKNLSQPVGMAASIAEHEAIAKAVREGDCARAGRLLAEHVGAARRRLEPQLQEE